MCFVGQYIDGEDTLYEYDLNDLETINVIPQDLIEHFDLYSEVTNYDELDYEDDD